MMPSRNMDPGECVAGEDDVPQAMAFTVTFDSAKATNNKFIKRHIRNLSLPITKIYDNRTASDSAVNGKAGRKQGNHSEGYFSSDPEEEHPKSKSRGEIKNGKQQGRTTPEGAAEDPRRRTLAGEQREHTEDHDDEEDDEEDDDDEDEEEEAVGSDVASETGTYTIERESPEVITARLSIDANFGIEQGTSHHINRDSTTWVNEWATHVVNHKGQSQNVTEMHSNVSKSNISRTQQGPTKIPSPLTSRTARFNCKNFARSKENASENHPSTVRTSTSSQRNKADESDSETERILKTTEKVMSALAARLSMDSGGESEGENTRRSGSGEIRRGGGDGVASGRPTNEPKSTSTTTLPATTTRYNRAFSLRRGRLEEPGNGKGGMAGSRSPPPAVAKTGSGGRTPRVESLKPPAPYTRPKLTPSPQGGSTGSISRTDTGRFSMRTNKPNSQGGNLSGSNATKKPPGGGRSNSTLSSKEVEFQNWKRRKSYDPMKAAAEGRRKEAANRRPPTTTTTTPKSPVNSVWRSASFHGTRQLGGGMPSSSDDEEETTLSAEEEDWPVPQGPKTSLQNSPRGSKGSLYSNSSNNSPHARQNLEGVDILLVSALYRLTTKQKGTASCILKKLRCLYDEESHKYKLLTSALEQLEQPEPSSSPHMSPSRELASTLTVSKRLNSTFKILNEVLFDEVELE